MRKKQLEEYCKTIEERNLRLRREIDEVKRGSADVGRMTDAILYEVVKKYGDLEIDLPTIGNEVSFKVEDKKLFITKKDAQEPIKSCGETCQEKDITTES
jgi:hypothetical protein